MKIYYDIIIIGGGHAGVEAANIASKMKMKVLLITMQLNNIGQMSCNPSIGGIGKGQIVKEIDALGGLMGKITDHSMIHFKMLNKSKGEAMWSPRGQCDRNKYLINSQYFLNKRKNIFYCQDIVKLLIIKNNKVYGVITNIYGKIYSKCVILSNGTFLNSIIHIGDKKILGGRLYENNCQNISNQLKKNGILYNRFKTGTSPRVDIRSLNLNKFIKQKSEKFIRFSHKKTIFLKKKKMCYLVHTNKKLNNIIKNNYNKCFFYKNKIKGPRYCISIEEKILKFNNLKNQIFIEYDGLFTNECYLNGFSISLPIKLQYKCLQTIKGFKNVKIIRPGYLVEYDYFLSNQLNYSLESKIIQNLYFAGQINGTTGYEEAAAQGIICGINASLKIQNKKIFILNKKTSYIGVLINDLINNKIVEPYRMFTSRAENRIFLRQDNADYRLYNYRYKLKLIKKKYVNKIFDKYKNIFKCIKKFKKKYIIINNKKINIFKFLSRQNVSIINFYKKKKIYYILNKYKIKKKDLFILNIEIKYYNYLKKNIINYKKYKNFKKIKINNKINYNDYNFLSKETKNKLNNMKNIKNLYDIFKIGIRPTELESFICFLNKK
ncbi:MAG: tRNA uridine-5-carboxymethylaminomethyl(34) synthesis enzyme MnmG [Candidatus Shikimatogenerans sp. Ttur]|uniref:tRNA uridine-5-carboxymethylaminomethyl(34) synthesis enzyme MnmG n=1 Tax=Candidatus Shikimatogenerans sp. Ttur TaxID=3158569 RepID=A0AAU7ZXG0_9FLAO